MQTGFETSDPEFFDKTVQEIQSCLDEVHEYMNSKAESGERDSLPAWTHKIKLALATLGHKLGDYKVYGSKLDKEADGREFLYDLCWLDYEKPEGFLRGAPLVVECEWGADNAIDDDFQKLVLARAKLKLIVFGENNKNNAETVENLIRHLQTSYEYQGSEGDRYLFAGYEGNNEGFRYWQCNGRGVLS